MNSRRFAVAAEAMGGPAMTRDGGPAFLRALERFQDVKSLFLQLDGAVAGSIART
jgi:hypothetical protein